VRVVFYLSGEEKELLLFYVEKKGFEENRVSNRKESQKGVRKTPQISKGGESTNRRRKETRGDRDLRLAVGGKGTLLIREGRKGKIHWGGS